MYMYTYGTTRNACRHALAMRRMYRWSVQHGQQPSCRPRRPHPSARGPPHLVSSLLEPNRIAHEVAHLAPPLLRYPGGDRDGSDAAGLRAHDAVRLVRPAGLRKEQRHLRRLSAAGFSHDYHHRMVLYEVLYLALVLEDRQLLGPRAVEGVVGRRFLRGRWRVLFVAPPALVLGEVIAERALAGLLERHRGLAAPRLCAAMNVAEHKCTVGKAIFS
jgi:hypothetical protein